MKDMRFKLLDLRFSPTDPKAKLGIVRKNCITVNITEIPDEATAAEVQNTLNGTYFPFNEKFWEENAFTVDYRYCSYGAIYPAQDARLIDAREIADLLGYSKEATATNLCRSGKLKSAKKFGNSWVADRLEVEEYRRWTQSRRRFNPSGSEE